MTTELHFRVVAPLELQYEDNSELCIERNVSRIKSAIGDCNASITIFEVVKVNKSEDADYPEIGEFIVDVQVQYYKYETKKSHYLCYQEFSQKWQESTRRLSEQCRPVLMFHDNGSFVHIRKTSHENISCPSVTFGTSPMPSLYIQYGKLDACTLTFCHDVRSLEAEYYLSGNIYRMIVSYHNIRKITVSSLSGFELFLDLFHPPLFYKILKKKSRYESYEIKARVLTSHIDVSIIGKANVIKLDLSHHDTSIGEEIVSRLHSRCSQLPIYYVYVSTNTNHRVPCMPFFDFSHFGCTYLLTAIFNRNFSILEQLNLSYNLQHFLHFLSENSTSNGECLEKALILVLSAIDSGKLINYFGAIKHFFQYYVNNKNEITFQHYTVPEKCRLIRRIMLTPTRMLLWAPEYMSENRVLRNFDSEFALRVNFRDDNISRLSWCALYTDEKIFHTSIKTPMHEGIVIGTRSFEFLAWSNSQIRDHGVWMYAKDEKGTTAADIREWMGDFSHIHNVSKHMARMGQCFSQTEDTVSVPLTDDHIRTEDDIERNGYCFSDGIGKISTGLAKKVHDALGHDKHCSAFQIRYGGYKGMLVVDPTLKDTDIVFRKSMKKFDSPQNTRLEICQTSAPGALQLNRPFITILNDLGVHPAVFLKLQEEQLRILTDMLFDEEKASKYLNARAPSGMMNYKDVSLSGISLTSEPFYRSLLLALHRHHVENIKTKATILIDSSVGRDLMGVLDETGILQYGQVFVQYTVDMRLGETTTDTRILTGEVLVTKNPCHHPGDVRKFQAVDVPQLHHIVDCIVFPQNGDRPHPNEMAGSDLDGDHYTCLWDKDLIFRGSNRTPANYPASEALNIPHITLDDIINFLMKYIRDDQIGVIANAHLAHADKYDISSSVCTSLARKCSIAVDFAKNGASAHLTVHEKPKEFPDFMEKNFKVTYKSNKSLGKMYRVCKDFESENEHASVSYSNVKVDPELVYPGWKAFEKDAVQSRNRYNSLLRSVLQTYGIQHEAEAFSGAFTQLHCRYQERKDKAEIEKVVIGSIKALSKNFLKEFLSEFSSTNLKTDPERMLQKASAWYVVTYRDNQSMFLSFAWVVSKYLANIKLLKRPAKIHFSPIIFEMDQKILECESELPTLSYETLNTLDQYEFTCDRSVVDRALKVLSIWAQDNHIVERPGYSTRGLLFITVFIKLVLHVAELEYYIFKRGKPFPDVKKKESSAASLCLAFLRFCVTLRFFNKRKMQEVLPFDVYKYKKLSKIAMVTYHTFALSGQFPALYFEEENHEDEFEMKEIHIDMQVFSMSYIPQPDLVKACETLVKYSGVSYVGMRVIRQTKKIVVGAFGNERNIKELKDILRKKQNVLRHLFATGVLLGEE